MINLLPTSIKKEIKVARTNVILARYCWFLLLSAIFLAGIFGSGIFITGNDKVKAEDDLKPFKAEISKFDSTKSLATSFSNDLKTAKSILSSEILLSKLITDIAGVLPSGVILSTLNLSTANLGKPISLTARATTYQKAVDLKGNLENSPLFEQVSIQSVTQSAGTTNSPSESYIDTKYPVTVVINVTASKVTPVNTGAKP